MLAPLALNKSYPYTYLDKKLYYYYLNNATVRCGWDGTRAALFVPNFNAEVVKRAPGIVIQDAGWHFSFLGSAQDIKDKLNAYSHQEYQGTFVGSLGNIEGALITRQDLFGRKIKFVETPINELPQYVQGNLQKFDKYLP